MPADKVTLIGSLCVLVPETVLIKAPPAFYRNHARDAQIVQFEIANLVGMKLFNDEENSIRYTFGRHIDDKLALLPKRVRRAVKMNDDF
jgi:hypothetical protein